MRVELSWMYSNTGDHLKAFNVIKDVIKDHPDHMPLYYQFGLLSSNTSIYSDKAVECLKKYLQRAPIEKLPWTDYAHYFLGRMSEFNKEIAMAIKEYENALKIDRKNKHANEALNNLIKK